MQISRNSFNKWNYTYIFFYFFCFLQVCPQNNDGKAAKRSTSNRKRLPLSACSPLWSSPRDWLRDITESEIFVNEEVPRGNEAVKQQALRNRQLYDFANKSWGWSVPTIRYSEMQAIEVYLQYSHPPSELGCHYRAALQCFQLRKWFGWRFVGYLFSQWNYSLQRNCKISLQTIKCPIWWRIWCNDAAVMVLTMAVTKATYNNKCI